MCRHLIGIVVGLFLFINYGCQKSVPENMYTDPQYQFRISIPDSGWTLTDETGISQVLVIIRSKGMCDGFMPNVTVSVEILPYMTTAVEYGKRNQESLMKQGYKIRGGKETVINQNTFYEVQCINHHASSSMQFRYLCLVKDRVGYIITCTAPEKLYANFVGDFECIVQTFRFL